MNYTTEQAVQDARFIKKYVALAKKNASNSELYYFYTNIIKTSGAIGRINKFRETQAKERGTVSRPENLTSIMRGSLNIDLLAGESN